MKIVAFLQLYNENERGNLRRCLDNCKSWADEIVIYDDASTDGSQEVYLEYTDKDLILFGNKNEFNRELFHKQELLRIALKLNPDWIGWIDGDAIFDRYITTGLPQIIESANQMGVDGVFFHNLNLWKDECWYRMDNLYNNLWHCCLWKNNGNLHYKPVDSLHKQQYPNGMAKQMRLNHQLLHYGFASREKIIEKYLRYKSHGQTGWALDRLIDEVSSYDLRKVDKNLYPDVNVPAHYDESTRPRPETYNHIRHLNSYEEYRK